MDPMTAVGEGLSYLGNTLGAAMKDDGDGPAGPHSGAVGPLGKLPSERRRENRPEPGLPPTSPEQREIQELYRKRMLRYDQTVIRVGESPSEREERSRKFWKDAEEEVRSKEKAEAATPSGGLPHHADAGAGLDSRPLRGTPGVLGGAAVGSLRYRSRAEVGHADAGPSEDATADLLDGPDL